MNINLVALLSQYLTPEMIGRIAGALGVDRTLMGKAATALAPALLRVLAGLAATPAGARRLAGAVEKQDPGILASLESAIGGTGQASLVKDGIGALESLLGGSGVSALGGALSRFSGLGQEAASSLIGLVTPTALGALHKEQAAQGLDASGLAKLLEAQKDNIAKALPAEFGDLLGKSGLPGFEPAAAPSPRIERPAAAPAPEAPSEGFNWRWIAAAVAAIALATSWYFSTRPAVEEQTKTTTGPAQALTVEGVDLRSSVQTALSGLKATLNGVRDTASAQAAVPQLEKGSIEFDKLRDLAGKLPIDAKAGFATLVAQFRPSIEELFNKVLDIPGVAPIAKPVIDRLRSKLDALSKPEIKA